MANNIGEDISATNLINSQLNAREAFDSMTVVMRMKKEPGIAHISVIMQTGHDQPEHIKEGIVFYYLTKPLQRDVLKSVIMVAIRDFEQMEELKSSLEKQKNSFGLIENCNFVYSTLNEAE